MNKRIRALIDRAPKAIVDMRQHNGRNFRMARLAIARAPRGRCKYGDTSCPCQDGDMCHYEGPNPMTPQFPIHPCQRDLLASVPWAFVAPHEHRALLNHDQTLARLAERGGLSLCELLAVVTDRAYYDVPSAERMQAHVRIKALLQEQGYD